MARTSGLVLFIMAVGSSLVLAAPTYSNHSNVPASIFDEVRDWSDIDTDKDSYVSADEMEAYLEDLRQQPSVNAARDYETASIRVTEVRNWSAAETDKDGYISADEMEAYLTQARERARTSTASEQQHKESQ